MFAHTFARTRRMLGIGLLGAGLLVVAAAAAPAALAAASSSSSSGDALDAAPVRGHPAYIARGGEIVLKDFDGDYAVVNEWSGLPADGSRDAMIAPPGVVKLGPDADAALVGVMERDEAGELVETKQAFVAYGEVTNARGEAVRTFEQAIEVGSTIGSGVVKNPGPEPLVAVVLRLDTGEVHEFDVPPGDGVSFGPGAPEVLVGTHEAVCACDCVTEDSGEQLREEFTISPCNVRTFAEDGGYRCDCLLTVPCELPSRTDRPAVTERCEPQLRMDPGS